MKDAMITVEGLSKRYRIRSAQRRAVGRRPRAPWLRSRSHDLWALRDVSFTVDPGEIVGIIGRNGAGKSTLLKVLTGITSPTSGRARMCGRIASLLEIGTGFHPELTGRQNVYLNGTLLGMTRREVHRKFDEIVDFAEVEEFLDTPMKHFSTGMQMRLAFAVAAHLDGEILIIDEALSVGDAAFQAKCMNAMKPVTGTARSVLFVSHNMGTILDLCSRVVWLDGGRVVMCDTADAAVDGYLSTGLCEASTTDGSLIVSDDVPRSGNGKARIVRIDVLDDEGNPCIGPRMGQGCTLRLHLRARCDMARFLVGLRITTSRGQRLFEMNNCEARQVLGPLRDGLVVDIHFDQVSLFPGKYGVTLTLRDASRHDLDILENVLALHVRPSGYMPATSPPLGPAYGLVAMPVRFVTADVSAAVEVA